MDSLELLDFSSFIIFSDDPWSLLVSFRQLFKFPLVVQCCNVICEWPLIEWPYNKNILHTEYICIKNVDVTEQNLHILSTFYSIVNLYTGCSMNGYDENIQKQMNE